MLLIFLQNKPLQELFLLFLPNWALDPPNTLFSSFLFSFACYSCDDLVISSMVFLLICKADSSAMNLWELREKFYLACFYHKRLSSRWTLYENNPASLIATFPWLKSLGVWQVVEGSLANHGNGVFHILFLPHRKSDGLWPCAGPRSPFGYSAF